VEDSVQFGERLAQVLRIKGIENYRAFERECDISNNQIANLLATGRCRSDILAKILMHPAFKDIDVRWLLTGEYGDDATLKTEVALLKEQFSKMQSMLSQIKELNAVTEALKHPKKKLNDRRETSDFGGRRNVA
jgi:hypothetical protein